MIVRELGERDVSQVTQIWERCHKGIRGIPNREYVISEALIEDQGVVLGYGLLRCFAEAMMFLDKDLSSFRRAKAFDLMMQKAISDSKRLGLDAINIGVDDLHFKKILEKKYHLTDRGTVLSLGLG